MQPVSRSESRSRRTPSVDPSTRSRRTPSSSRIDFHTSRSPSPPSTTLSSSASPPVSPLCPPPSSTAHFLAALASVTSTLFTTIALALAPSNVPITLALAVPACLAATIFLLPFARPRRSALRLLFRRPMRPTLFTLALLHLLALLANTHTINILGPYRALLVFTAHPSTISFFSRSSSRLRPRPIPWYPLLSLIALLLLAHDVVVGPTANTSTLHPTVLSSRAVRVVHTRLTTLRDGLSNTLRLRNHSTLAASLSAFNPRRPRLRRDRRRRRISTDSNGNTVPQPPVIPPQPQQPQAQPPPARRLLSIVRPEDDNSLSKQNPVSDVRPPPVPHSANVSQHKSPPQPANSHNLTIEQNISRRATTHISTNSTTAVMSPRPRIIDAVGPTLQTQILNESTPGSISTCLAILLGVVGALLSRIANELAERQANEAGDALVLSMLSFAIATMPLIPVLCAMQIASATGAVTFIARFYNNTLLFCALVGITYLALPALLLSFIRAAYRRQGSHNRSPKVMSVVAAMDVSVLRLQPLYFPKPVWLFSLAIGFHAVNRAFSLLSIPSTMEVSPAIIIAAILLLVVSWLDTRRALSDRRHGLLSGSSSDLTAYFRSGMPELSFAFSHIWRSAFSRIWRSAWDAIVIMLRAMADLGIHARSNRASWQVLNFLVLQSGMAVAELIYASATNATGLFSISADNFFCSIALAVGLLAIRFSTRSPSLVFSYGHSRIESICGFANGIMLIYVALLVLLEAFERVSQEGSMAVGRAFSVCLFGIVGNALGLYFFPPESRRENHNVQGIYLHICANTLAFASVAISTATTAAMPDWRAIDLATAAIVALGVVAFAVPLIIRSARLLLLMVPVERVGMLRSVEERLSDISGVVMVSGLRVWNLTPNSMVASVRLEIAHENEDLDIEVLAKARSAFARMGIPASKCTIQISGSSSGRSDSPVFVHRRHRPGFVDTSLDIDLPQAT